MSLPIVAVVGRPNVGKSTLGYRIALSKDAIVHEQRGVTRDRSYHKADWNGRHFTLIDTGGIEMAAEDAFQSSIRNQAQMAIEEADAIILMVDSRAGLTADDGEVARMMKRSGRPVLLAVNKMDNPAKEDDLWQFYNLGLGEPWPISSVHGHGTGDMLDALVDVLPSEDDEPDDDSDISIAIIGRPNAGKSSLTNRLLGKERSIVSDVAGTTRDAIDTIIERNGINYRIIDTAGIRRKSQIDTSVEYYGFVRALRAIERADVALLMIDSTIGLTDQDQRTAGLAHERGCALIILLNKWDLLETLEEREALRTHITDRMTFVSYAPVIAISALTGRSVHRIWDSVNTAYANFSSTISTPKLNNFLTQIRDFGHTVSRGKLRLRINYITQTGTCPPKFTLFANHPHIIDDNFKRYLENRMRETFDLEGTPIALRFKKKE